ncbi:MAG: DUF4349 domain-containing protein [Clostridiales bacterium]|jgi:hypothetical protein|nr:DUF4349 domain-containing protein [Clostridiales bacterium]
MHTCSDLEELIPQFIDGALDDEDKKRLEEHLETCEACKQSLLEMSSMIEALHGIPQIEPPMDFHIEVMKKISAETKKDKKTLSFFSRLAAAAAGMAATLLVLSALVSAIHSAASSKPELYASAEDAQGSIALKAEMNSAAVQARLSDASAEPSSFGESPAPASSGAAPSSYGPPEGINALSYNISIRVDDIEEAVSAIESMGGYNESSGIDAGRGGYAGSGHIYRRIDLSEYDEAKALLKSLGKVTYEGEAVSSYASREMDLNAQMAAKAVEKQRLEELLGKSASMDVMIRVESQLSSVQEQYEAMRGELNSIEAQASMPIISITLDETYKPEAVMPESGFGLRMRNSFVSSFNGTAAFMEAVVVFASGAFLPVALIALFGAGALYIFRALRRKKQ